MQVESLRGEKKTIGKALFLPAVSRRLKIPPSHSFIHSFIQLVWRIFHYTALSVVFGGRERLIDLEPSRLCVRDTLLGAGEF